MATFEIPLTNTNPSFIFQVDLEGVNFEFRFRWNGRMQNWIVDLFDAVGTVVQTGYPFIVSYPLFRQNVTTNKYPGILGALNTETPGSNADRFNIGGDVKFQYLEST
jgi:hypothetical protein